MKNAVLVIVTLIVIALVICGCYYWYISATTDSSTYVQVVPPVENNNPVVVDNPVEKEEVISSEPIFTKEDYPRVDASLAIHPLVDSLAANFLAVEEDELDYEYTKTRTSDVYQRLIDGEVDVVFVAEPSQKDYDYAASKGVELDVMPVTSSAFVFIVNSQNPVDSLTLDQIVDIYKGNITNWKEVGGEDMEIIPYQRPNGSGSQTAMISLVMKDATFMSAPKMQIEGEMGGLVDAIAEYDNSQAAIGYSYFYYINTMYKRDTIKMLGINGVKPTIASIKDGSYPIYTNGFIATVKGRAEEGSAAKKWIDAVISARGSKVIEDAGYVPIH